MATFVFSLSIVVGIFLSCILACNYNGVDYKIGDKFKSTDGCNECVCGAIGVVCTKMMCMSTDAPKPSLKPCTEVVGGVTMTYVDGESYKSPDGCNTCSCHDGMSMCTLMACFSSSSTCTDTKTGSVYKDGESFKSSDGCNTCYCKNSFISCTEMACINTNQCTDTKTGSVYKDGESFKSSDGCNTCYCKNSLIACTEMACFNANQCFDSTTGQIYQDGESFMAPDGCNSCTCKGGLIACTKKLCIR